MKYSKTTRYNLPVIVEFDEDGYFVSCPSFQGCYSQGKTYEEAMNNIEDAIKLHIEDKKEAHEEIANTRSISISSVEVTA